MLVLTTDENFTRAGDGPPESLRTSENATNVGPNDGDTDVPPNSDLAWGPGEFAATHHVYFGTSFDDVNSASVGDSRCF